MLSSYEVSKRLRSKLAGVHYNRDGVLNLDELGDIILESWRIQKEGEMPLSILVVGPPGIGKTWKIIEVAQKIAEEEGKQLVLYEDIIHADIDSLPDDIIVLVAINISTVLPEDFMGLPREGKDGVIDYQLQRWIKIAERVPTIVFLDDVGNIKDPSVRSQLYELVQFHRLPTAYLKKAMIIMATNDSKSNIDVEEFSNAFTNRAEIHRVGYDFKCWKNWVVKEYGLDNIPEVSEEDLHSTKIRPNVARHIIARILEIIEMSNNSMKYAPPEKELSVDPWPSPRSWDRFFRELVTGEVSWDNIFKRLHANVGETAAFTIKTLLTKEIPNPLEVLNNPESYISSDRVTAALSATVVAEYLSSGGSVEYDKVLRFAVLLFNEYREAFIVFWRKSDKYEKRIKLFKDLKKRPEFEDFFKTLKSG